MTNLKKCIVGIRDSKLSKAQTNLLIKAAEKSEVIKNGFNTDLALYISTKKKSFRNRIISIRGLRSNYQIHSLKLVRIQFEWGDRGGFVLTYSQVFPPDLIAEKCRRILPAACCIQLVARNELCARGRA